MTHVHTCEHGTFCLVYANTEFRWEFPFSLKNRSFSIHTCHDQSTIVFLKSLNRHSQTLFIYLFFGSSQFLSQKDLLILRCLKWVHNPGQAVQSMAHLSVRLFAPSLYDCVYVYYFCPYKFNISRSKLPFAHSSTHVVSGTQNWESERGRQVRASTVALIQFLW